METFLLALDQGTTSSRAILFDRNGSIRGVAQQEFPQIFPRSGWVEHDPMEIWNSQAKVAARVLAEQGVSASQIAGIGITNQRETTLVWDRRTGEPVGNAIVWQDRRTAPVCQTLKAEGKEALVREKTGLVLDAYFSATKIQWILDHVEGARARAERGELAFGTVDSWLIWNLTGGAVHATDVTNASRTLLYDIHARRWDPELLDLFDVPASMLPEVRPSSEVVGTTTEGALPAGLPIAGIAGDQQAALFGQMCMDRSMVKNTYGTGCFMLMNIGSKPLASRHNLLTTVAWQVGDRMDYAFEGSVFIAGAVVQWLRDGLGILRSSGEIEALAAQVPDTDGVYFVPAFAGLGAPHWNPDARGTIVGLSRGTTNAHLARAALESMAFQSLDVLRAMESDSGHAIPELRVDGGASANNLLMQFQADILGSRVIRPGVTETTAQGAAYLAGLATGFWQDVSEIQHLWNMDRPFEPTADKRRVNELVEGWKKAVRTADHWTS